jgi:hypothetical protein
MNLLEKILVGWFLLFALPKLIFVPMFRAMYNAMASTDRQDEIDAEWLAAYERRHHGGDDGFVRHRRRRRPKPTRPRKPGGLGPVRHGAMAVRKRRERSEPVRAVSR